MVDKGSGESYESWKSVTATLSRQTRVCAYDRAGYGRSEPGPVPRDSQRAVEGAINIGAQERGHDAGATFTWLT